MNVSFSPLEPTLRLWRRHSLCIPNILLHVSLWWSYHKSGSETSPWYRYLRQALLHDLLYGSNHCRMPLCGIWGWISFTTFFAAATVAKCHHMAFVDWSHLKPTLQQQLSQNAMMWPSELSFTICFTKATVAKFNNVALRMEYFLQTDWRQQVSQSATKWHLRLTPLYNLLHGSNCHKMLQCGIWSGSGFKSLLWIWLLQFAPCEPSSVSKITWLKQWLKFGGRRCQDSFVMRDCALWEWQRFLTLVARMLSIPLENCFVAAFATFSLCLLDRESFWALGLPHQSCPLLKGRRGEAFANGMNVILLEEDVEWRLWSKSPSTFVNNNN